MNIEEANDNLIMLKYFLQEEGDENWEKYCEAIETLLTAKKITNLIEKQQKEIEELKNADLTTVYLNGVYDGEKKAKDKIKAKIEEIDEVLKGQLIEKIRVYFEAQKEVLQSLLEKE